MGVPGMPTVIVRNSASGVLPKEKPPSLKLRAGRSSCAQPLPSPVSPWHCAQLSWNSLTARASGAFCAPVAAAHTASASAVNGTGAECIIEQASGAGARSVRRSAEPRQVAGRIGRTLVSTRTAAALGALLALTACCGGRPDATASASATWPVTIAPPAESRRDYERVVLVTIDTLR